MKKKIDWLNHSLEFIVVVVGILIAFQLDNFAQEKKQISILDSHREYILDETRVNEQFINSALVGSEASKQKILQLLELIDNQGDLALINQRALELLRYDFAYIKKNAYSTLTESGDIRYMSFDEKTRIINLYEYYGWVGSIDVMAAETHQKIYAEMVRTHIDMSGGQPEERAFYESKVFKNALLSYQYSLTYKVSKYKDCLEVMKTYLKST